jgi:hypothetical protein
MLPIMSPKNGGAPIENWPGLSVSMLKVKTGTSSTAKVDGDHCQWVVNLSNEPCEIHVDGEKTILNKFDLIRVEPGATRTLQNIGTEELNILIATQSKETIEPQAIH